MSYWLALIALPSSPPAEASAAALAPTPGGPQHALGCWALQFTPRVALLEEAVLMEVQASLRLFGGARALCERVAEQAHLLGCPAWARAPTARAALAFARAGVRSGAWAGVRADVKPDAKAAEDAAKGSKGATGQLATASAAGMKQVPPVHEWQLRLDVLPLQVLSEAAAREPLLARLGCRCLGDLRRLPRAGLSRRAGQALVSALDQAYGLRPESFEWLALPEVFESRLELPGRVESAAALLFAARRLVLQMCGWLAARQAGVRHFVLQWRHDFHRPGVEGAGEWVVRTGELTREPDHLCRLLAEWLPQVKLAGPVGELRLRADTVEPLAPRSAALALEAGRAAAAAQAGEGESLLQLLERLSARLGAQQVLRPVLCDDHRPESMQCWLPATQWAPQAGAGAGANSAMARAAQLPALPQPSWLLREPQALSVRDHRPQWQGPLQLLAGPHRLEAGWWAPAGAAGQVARDYFVAFNERAGLLWVFRERRSESGDTAMAGWFLHGIFG